MNRNLVVLAFIFTTLCCLPPSYGQNLPQATTAMIQRDRLLQTVRSMDPLGDTLWRPTIEGGYRSPFGIQLFPSCFEALPRGIDRQSAQIRWDNMIAEVSGRMVQQCVLNFPELAEYAREWLSQMRRTVVYCPNLSPEDFALATGRERTGRVSAVHIPDTQTLRFWRIPSHELWASAGEGGSYASAHRPLLLFTRHFMNSIFERSGTGDGYDLYNIVYLMHELLHSTGANNEHAHNTLQGVSPNSLGYCGQDRRVDRIDTMSALCTNLYTFGNPGERGVLQRPSMLYERIRHCGLEQGCIRTFTSHLSWYDQISQNMLSRPLAHERAHRLCQRIESYGYCSFMRETQGYAMTRSNPALEDIGNRLLTRFREILPRAFNHIPAGFLRVFPDIKLGFEALQASPCFQSLLSQQADGSYYLRGPGVPRIWGSLDMNVPITQVSNNDDLESRRRPLSTDLIGLVYRISSVAPPRSLFYHMRGWAQETFSQAPRCHDRNTQQALLHLFEIMDARMTAIDSSKIYRSAFFRALGTAEFYQDILDANMSQTSEITARQFIGEPLFTEYLNRLARHHHNSPHFDCAANGLSLSRPQTRNIPLRSPSGSDSKHRPFHHPTGRAPRVNP